MTPPIIQIVYYSIATQESTQEFIQSILEQSRESNAKKNITGCLLYHNNIFLQLLEGEESVVNSLYDRICKDSRHQEITLVCNESVNERIFPDWSMAFHQFEKNDLEMERFVKSIHFFAKNTNKQTQTIEFFWNMARLIVNN